MSLTCVECATVNADGDAFCTGCGVSLALAMSSAAMAAVPVAGPFGGMAAPVAAMPRNAFPEEPGRVSGGSNTLPWLLVGALVLALGAAVVGSGRWALQRMSAPDAPAPITSVQPAVLSDEFETRDAAMDATTDTVMDAAMDTASEVPSDTVKPGELTMVDPGRSVRAPPPVVASPRTRAVARPDRSAP